MLGFGILALKRLTALPDAEFSATLTALGFVWLPIMYYLWTYSRPLYIRYRQPIVVLRKAVAVAISTTYAVSFYDSMHGSNTAGSPGLTLFMSSIGISSQLLTHAMGFPNYGSWQLVSQGMGTIMAFRTGAVMCQGQLAQTLHRFVISLPSHSFFDVLKESVAADPPLTCCIYCIGLHSVVGFTLATVLSNILEFRHRRRFSAERFPNRAPLSLSDLHHKEWVNVLLVIIMYVAMEGLTTAVDMAILGATTRRTH
jgi:hypothetical protein